VDPCRFAHLGRAGGLDPALGGDAHASHPSKHRDKLEVDVGKRLTAASSRAARSHSSGPRQAVSKSRSSSPSAVRSQLPACGLPCSGLAAVTRPERASCSSSMTLKGKRRSESGRSGERTGSRSRLASASSRSKGGSEPGNAASASCTALNTAAAALGDDTERLDDAHRCLERAAPALLGRRRLAWFLGVLGLSHSFRVIPIRPTRNSPTSDCSAPARPAATYRGTGSARQTSLVIAQAIASSSRPRCVSR
jgi:hypothetical protein